MLKELLKQRKIASVWDHFENANPVAWSIERKAIIDLLCQEEYGFIPCASSKPSYEVLETDHSFCAGKVTLSKVILTTQFENRVFSFPFYASVPNGNGRYPFFVYLSFQDHMPDKYIPIEEICDHGFAVLSFCYSDIASDDNDFSSALAGAIYGGKARSGDDCGKIAMWSWAASRVMDYAQTLSNLDLTKAAVIGHSRLGKTALLAGVLDERFSYVISNDSGCSGAAISRGKQGEQIKDICNAFPYWFCENYKKYVDNEYSLPFDQHFLLASIAPRKLYVASAQEDTWADPNSEYLACVAASEVYEKIGLVGFVHPDRLPITGDVFHDGNIGYHLRRGSHYLSREDWLRFMDFFIK